MRVVFCRPWLGLVWVFALVVGCRPPLPPPGADAGADGGLSPPDLLSLAAPDCTKASDCITCCNGFYESGALVFDQDASACACKTSPCAGACATSVCGNLPGATAACLACVDGLAGDGGACQQPVNDCLTSDGPCGTWKSCAESCAGAGTS
jgi:hypothetical protein